MARERLPDRRPAVTREIDYASHRFIVTVGFDRMGRPKEVFASGAKIGTDLGHTIADACVWASLLLQYGCPPAGLERSIGRVPDPSSGSGACRPASVLGVIAAAIVEAARQAGLEE